MTKTSMRAAVLLALCGLLFVSVGVLVRLRASAENQTEKTGVHSAAAGFDWETYAQKEAAWWSGEEAGRLAEEIVGFQAPEGGWRKGDGAIQSGPWQHATIDNDVTWGQIRFLARAYTARGNETWRTACRKGIDYLLTAQYENGGWPQIAALEGTYHAHITFNDDAMTEVMRLLGDVAERSPEEGFAWVDDALAREAAQAFDRGLDCILRCQIRVDGRLTAWCQQYDEQTLLPAGGRAYEPPALGTRESVAIVKLLQSLPEKTPAVEESIEAALRWFEDTALRGLRFEPVGDDRMLRPGAPEDLLWARFYDLDGVTPLFGDRDGRVCYDLTEISKERRTGYDWYGTWPLELLKER